MKALVIAAAAVGLCLGVFLAGCIVYLLFFLPFTLRSARLLPPDSRRTVDGITTIDDAVAACRASGLRGVGLVTFAQRIAERKFEYSRRNPWDSWERCFERGMGYCIQQAMALKMIYDRLGVEARPVQAFRARFPAAVVHGEPRPPITSGHMWLRVRVDGTEYDVCPGSPSNRPGVIDFVPVSRVMEVPGWLVPVLHVFSAAENVRRDWPLLFKGATP